MMPSPRRRAPEWSVRWHTGYQPRETDLHDVLALCERLDIVPPAGIR
jgi:lincosamide nucleotidyltransferase A/C/D/E